MTQDPEAPFPGLTPLHDTVPFFGILNMDLKIIFSRRNTRRSSARIDMDQPKWEHPHKILVLFVFSYVLLLQLQMS